MFSLLAARKGSNYLVNNRGPFIVIHKAWKKGDWIKCEREYLQKMGVHLLFTDFENGWGDKVADEILRVGFQ